MRDGSDQQATGQTTGQVAPFDAIRHESDDEGEYWSARELGKLLGYVQWRNFVLVIEQARTACETSGHGVSDHFADVSKMVTIGSGARRRLDDVHLSRYACYLIVQNADPEKPIVALGQTYFAVCAVAARSSPTSPACPRRRSAWRCASRSPSAIPPWRRQRRRRASSRRATLPSFKITAIWVVRYVLTFN